MKKFRFFLDFEKEEKWLNTMAKQGWELCGKSFTYKFKKIEPTNAIIKIDYRTFKNNSDFEDYLALFRDSGWEHVSGSKHSGTQYFKKINENDINDIFSDTPSKAVRYKRLSSMWVTMAMSYFPIFVALVLNKAVNFTAFQNPKLLYYTPGLWERSGVYFWKGFLFETPFAVMRGFAWLLFPILIILYLAFAIKSESLYRNTNSAKQY
jgi:hypothetical protein